MDNPLRVLDCKDEACRAVAAEAPVMLEHLCDACDAHFDEVVAGVRAAGLAPVMTPTLVRGLDYYTRTAFEFVSDALQEGGNAQQATLFGGGRYDGLAEALGGPRVPGVGFGMGLERVLLAVADEGLAPPIERPLDAYVVAIGEAARAAARPLVAELRAAGLAADLAYEDRPLKAQLKMADRADARTAVIIGEQELAAGTVTVRRMDDGHQTAVPLGELAATLSTDGGSA